MPVFRGVAPRIAPRLLPDEIGQLATNAKLLDGNLTGWKKPKAVAALPGHGDKEPSLALYKMMLQNAGVDVFLRWPTVVEVARGPVAGDITERLYFTGALDDPAAALDSIARPKVTNFQKAVLDAAHAGVDADEYPHDWLILGVPAPATAPSVDNVVVQDTPTVFSDGTSLAPWTTDSGAPVANDATMGGTCIKLPSGAQVHANVGRGQDDGDSISALIRIDAASKSMEIRFGCDAAGLGAVIKLTASAGHDVQDPDTATGAYSVGTVATWAGAPVYTQNGSIPPTQYRGSHIVEGHPEPVDKYLSNFRQDWNYNLGIVVEEVSAGVFHATVSVGSFSVEFEFTPSGDLLGFKGVDGIVFFDTVTVGGAVQAADERTVSYLYTWINELGDEGAPSAPSAPATISSGLVTTVSDILDPSAGQIADYGLTGPNPLDGTNGFKRVYRAVTGSTTTVFRKVIDLPYSVTSFVDDVADESLGIALESKDWDLPPEDGHSILALPNGITLMASGNEVCPSVQNRPHTFPVGYRLATDFPIVGLGAIDTTAFVLTQANPYMVIGSDPSAMSMAKYETYEWGCVARRSIASLAGVGVVYASPDGLVALSRSAPPRLLTENVFTREQWQALKPESIHARVHDGRYVFFWRNDAGDQGGFIVDPRQGGMGLVPLDLSSLYLVDPNQPTAMYSDPLTDRLHLAVPGDPDGSVERWDPTDDVNQPQLGFRWRSKVWVMPYETSFGAAQVKGRNLAGDEDNVALSFNYYVNDVLVFTKDNPGEGEFVLPDVVGTRFELEVIATDDADVFPIVEAVQVAESMDELA